MKLSEKNELNNKLLLAASRGSVAEVSSSLSMQADIDTRNEYQLTPLHLASRGGHTDVMSVLILAGASIQATNQNDNTPLHSAAYGNQESAIIVLIAHGANKHAVNKDGDTPLHSAAWKGMVQSISTLAACHARLNVKNKDGDAPVHLAAWNNHSSAIEELAKWGADLDCQNDDGETALHLAARKCHQLSIEQLLIKGASSTQTDHAGRTFFQVPEWNNYVLGKIKAIANELSVNYLRQKANPGTKKELDDFFSLIKKIEHTKGNSSILFSFIESDLNRRVFQEFGSIYSGDKKTVLSQLIKSIQENDLDPLPSFRKEISQSKGYQKKCSEILSLSFFHKERSSEGNRLTPENFRLFL